MAREAEVLNKIGLGQREAKVYLLLLHIGESTATKISSEVDIDRTTTYDVLNRLINKGIVSYIIKNGIKYFNPVNPESILRDLQEKEEQLKEIMPKLLALNSERREESSVEVFKGKEGVVSVLKMILEDKKDYLFIGAMHENCVVVPIYINKFLREAYDLGLHGKLICEEGFGDYDVDVVGKNEKYRMISKEFTSTTTQIWGNKTAFFIFKEPYYTIVIESKDIANRHRLYFEYLWQQAKEPNKEHKKKTLIKSI